MGQAAAAKAKSAPSPALSTLVQRVRPVAMAGVRLLPVLTPLTELFPDGGLRRGTTVTVAGSGSTSLILAMTVAASAGGSWAAMVAMGDLGVIAAADAGLDMGRVALVPKVPPSQWPVVVGALIDAVDIVVAAPPAHLRAGDARRLSTRTRERGCVLVVRAGGRGPAWSNGVDVRLQVVASAWTGPDHGYGRLERRAVEVAAAGRGAAVRERRVRLWLPAGPDAVAAMGSGVRSGRRRDGARADELIETKSAG
jgi:hypothetical protein